MNRPAHHSLAVWVAVAALGAVALVALPFVVALLVAVAVQEHRRATAAPSPGASPARGVRFSAPMPDDRRRLALAALVGRLPGEPFDPATVAPPALRAFVAAAFPDVAAHIADAGPTAAREAAAAVWASAIAPQPPSPPDPCPKKS